MASELKGRGFLNPDNFKLDAYTWSLKRYPKDNPRHWVGSIDFRLGKTLIVLHTTNDDGDRDFVRFKTKLTLLFQALSDFIDVAPSYDFKKKGRRVDRQWLNPADGEDYAYTGSIVTVLDEGECSFEISSCDRSHRFYITPATKTHGHVNQKELLDLLGVKRGLNECLMGIEQLISSI